LGSPFVEQFPIDEINESVSSGSADSSSFTDCIVIDDTEALDSDAVTLVDENLSTPSFSLPLSDDSQQDMNTERTNVTRGATGSNRTLNPEATVFTPAFSHNNTPASVNMTASATGPAGQQAPVPIVAGAVNAGLVGNTTSHHATTYGTAHGTFAAGLAGSQFQAPTFPHGLNNTHHLVGPFNGMAFQNPVHNNNPYAAHVVFPYAAYNPMTSQTPQYNGNELGHAHNHHVGINPPFPNSPPSMTTVTMGLMTDSNNTLQVGNVVSSLAVVNYGRNPAERHAGYNALRQLHHLWINPARRPVRGMYYFDGEKFYLHHREDDHHAIHGHTNRGHSAGGYAGGCGGCATRGRNTHSRGQH
jgi:hypothetical protein